MVDIVPLGGLSKPRDMQHTFAAAATAQGAGETFCKSETLQQSLIPFFMLLLSSPVMDTSLQVSCSSHLHQAEL